MRLAVPGKFSKVPDWYHNSWSALESPRSMERYEQVYNVKIITRSKYITHVEFQSEADSVLFVLRWS